MTKINVYDFDGTVYRGDSSVDFFLFCLRRFPANIILLPKVAAALLQYKVHLCSKEHLKSVFFSFVKNIYKELFLWIIMVNHYLELI